MPLLLDTGPLYALADADDAWHERIRDFLAARDEVLLVPVTVLPEVAYLLRSRLAADPRASRLIPDEEKVARADFAFVNDGSLAELDSFVADVLEQLDRRA